MAKHSLIIVRLWRTRLRETVGIIRCNSSWASSHTLLDWATFGDFPTCVKKNGGGAFLIPYIIMMAVEGMPLFLIELGIGQRLRTGPVGVWNAIHPYLGGVGVSAAIVSFLVALYYNVIITWCIYYLFNSFTTQLPWSINW
uniref:Sodium-and chloride-dependent transporter XTRP3B n=1 Tax=Ascaris suum TaxID=6253 RepID=F1LEZ8_ASCSU